MALFAGTTGKHIKPITLTSGMIRIGVGGAGVVTLASPNVDYALPVQNSFPSIAGTASSPDPWGTVSGVTVMVESTGLNTGNSGAGIDAYARLPLAGNYAAGTIITYVDTTTTKNFGRNFQAFANGTDKLDGVTQGSNFPNGTPWIR